MAKDSGDKKPEETSLKKSAIRLDHFDFSQTQESGEETPTLAKSILRVLNGPAGSFERLAFEVDPSISNSEACLYRPKRQLIPDAVLKRIAIQDDLVAAIVNCRSNQVAAFGRPRPDRFSTGFVIEPKPGVVTKLSSDQKQALDDRIETAIEKINNCGETGGLSRRDRCTFSQYLQMGAKNAVTVGRIATELVYGVDASGEKKFSRFRAIDAGTILQAAHQTSSTESVRKEAVRMLSQVKNKKLVDDDSEQDTDYAWVQVIDGNPRQVFTDKECVVHNFYPVLDVELDGYPVTPIDTMLSAVTTHINITSHNKIYFQSGRATRGMLLIKSADVDETAIARVKQQFNASINNVNNAWRMPVFALAPEDDIQWTPIDNSSRDAEFQYLTDMNARVILSAFQMSPDELPGWSHLSRGTNSQALSESNEEFKLQGARDLGIRPLLNQFEDFFNASIFPLIDPSLAKICRFRLIGLEAETAEKETVRLQQDMPVHMTYNQVLDKVEKRPVGKAMGGDYPLNPQFQTVLDKYFTVGDIKEFFMGVEGASKDPSLAYFRDPFWFQFQQLQDARQQMQQQMQQAQAQAQAQQGQAPGQPPAEGSSGAAPGSEQGPGEGVSDTGQPSEDSGGSKKPYDVKTENAKNEESGQDLTRSIDQAIGVLTKGEESLPPSKRRILAQQRQVMQQALEGWEDELAAATADIVEIAKKHTKRST